MALAPDLTVAAATSEVIATTLSQQAAAGSSDWVEGAAIMAAVVVVVGVGATTNYEKEGKFRQLTMIKEDIKVNKDLRSSHPHQDEFPEFLTRDSP